MIRVIFVGLSVQIHFRISLVSSDKNGILFLVLTENLVIYVEIEMGSQGSQRTLLYLLFLKYR